MAQPAVPPFVFHGPFRGVLDAVAGRQLGPGYAKAAHNVQLLGGRVRPREPWKGMGTLTGLLGAADQIRALHVWRERPGRTFYIFKASQVVTGLGDPGEWGNTRWYMWEDGRTALHDLGAGQFHSPHAAQFALANGRLFIADGSESCLHTSPSGARKVGVPKPTWASDPVTLANLGGAINIEGPLYGLQAGPAPNGDVLTSSETYRFAFTFVEFNTGAESSMLAMPNASVLTSLVGGHFKFGIATDKIPAPLEYGALRVRVYRQNVNLGEPFFRLVAEASGGANVVYDGQSDDVVELSSTTTGPYAPSRNAIPPGHCHSIAWHGDRMFYGSSDEPSKLFYSELGLPNAVDPTNFLNIEDEGGSQITGLFAHSHQLLIGTEGGIHILSGNIDGPDNDTDALGTSGDLPKSRHLLFRSRASTGPDPQFGPTFVLAGQPGAVHFSTSEGHIRFDGVNTHNLSAERTPLRWRKFWKRCRYHQVSPSITYTQDKESGVLYMSNWTTKVGEEGQNPPVTPGPEMLGYYWRSQDWVTAGLSGSEDSLFATTLAENVDATIVAAFSLLTGAPPVLFLVGGSDAPAWFYETHPMEIVPGRRIHLYHAKMMLARAQNITGNPGVRVMYVLDGELVREAGRDFMFEGKKLTRLFPIRRSGDDIAFRFERASGFSVGSFDNGGVVSFNVDFELEGV